MSKNTKKIKLMLALLVFAGGAIAQQVKVSIDWKVVNYEVGPFAYALNTTQAFNPGSVSNSKYSGNLTYMNPGIIRYWGDLMSDQKHGNGWLDETNRTWAASKIHQALSNLPATYAQKCITPDFPSWMLDANGFLAAGQEDAYANFCADLVRIVNKTYQGHYVKYWEVTNEKDIQYYNSFADKNQPDRLDELINIYNKAAKAMKAVDPTILIGGFAVSEPQRTAMIQRMINGTIDQSNPTTLDFFSYHFYGEEGNGPDVAAFDSAENGIGSTAQRVYNTMNGKSRRVPLWMDEYNIAWNWKNLDPRMKNYKGATFDALAIISSLDNGAECNMSWNEWENNYGKMNLDFSLNVGANLFKMLNSFMRGSRVASSKVAGRISTLAVKSGSRKSFLIVNRTTESINLSIDFKGWAPNTTTFDKYRISSAGYTTGSENWSVLSGGDYSVPPLSETLLTIVDVPVAD